MSDASAEMPAGDTAEGETVRTMSPARSAITAAKRATAAMSGAMWERVREEGEETKAERVCTAVPRKWMASVKRRS